MAVLVEFGIPTEDLAFHELFKAFPAAELEFELAVSGGSPLAGRLVWISGVDQQEVMDFLQDHPMIERVTLILDRNGSFLCEIVVDTSEMELFDALAAHSAYLLDATGRADGWRFEVLFPDRHDISPFIADCQSRDIGIHTRRVDTSPFPDRKGRLTPEQADALEIALSDGYWEVPRSSSLQTVADELGISDQAASERLRRGIKTLLVEELGNGR